jgi:hypothetical protein
MMANARNKNIGFAGAIVSGAALPIFLLGEAVNNEPIPIVPGGIIIGLGSFALAAVSHSLLTERPEQISLDN